MKAIQVKYLPVTETKGSRYKAWIDGGASVTVGFNHVTDLGEDDAMNKLKEKLNWKYDFIKGTLPNGDFVYVIQPK